MRTSVRLGTAYDSTIFTVRVEGKTYTCPVSREALYELCKSQDARHDRIDSYLDLKSKIYRVVERLVKEDSTVLPAVLEAKHFLP
jgi:hypothetical protein